MMKGLVGYMMRKGWCPGEELPRKERGMMENHFHSTAKEILLGRDMESKEGPR